MNNQLKEFFGNGGVFLFDESDGASERTYYAIEDFMGSLEGEFITETYVDEDGELCLYYDSEVLSEEEVLDKYKEGQFVKSL